MNRIENIWESWALITSSVPVTPDASATVQNILQTKEIKEHTLETGLIELYSHIDAELASGKKPVIVLVAWGSASGKTSRVAEELSHHYDGKSCIMSLDSFYRWPSFMKNHPELNWDHPDALDLQLAADKIAQLKSGVGADIPSYNFRDDPIPDALHIEPQDVIIIEWLFSLRGEFVNLGDVSCYVDISPHGRLIRRLMRDAIGGRTGQTLSTALAQIVSTVEPMHSEFVDTTKINAQVRIRNEYNPLIESLRTGKHEFQVKFPIPSEMDLEELLSSDECIHFVASLNQDDIYYTPQSKNLHPEEILRIRSEIDWQHPEEKKSHLLTYKWPLVTDPENKENKTRYILWVEIEPELEKEFIAHFTENQSLIRIKKERMVYDIDDSKYWKITFRLDEISAEWNGVTHPHHSFVEIVVPENEQNPEKYINYAKQIIQTHLHLDIMKATNASYRDIFTSRPFPY